MDPVIRVAVAFGDSTVLLVGADVSPAALLRHAVVGSVDDAPLDDVPLLVEAFKDDREVAAALFRRRKKKTVDILQEEHRRGLLALLHKNIVDGPLEDTFLPLDAL